MDRAFEGLDNLTNLTEDIPDFWGVMDMDPTLMSDALPLLLGDMPQLPPPLENPIFSTHELEELISPTDLAAL